MIRFLSGLRHRPFVVAGATAGAVVAGSAAIVLCDDGTEALTSTGAENEEKSFFWFREQCRVR
jgi:hypothetical protein